MDERMAATRRQSHNGVVRTAIDAVDFSTNPRSFAMWTKPAATEMRFGFEVTMYVCNR